MLTFFLVLIRIVLGVAWVGMAVLFVLFFEAVVRMAGPADGVVRARMDLRESPMTMGLVGMAMVAGGVPIYLQAAGGFRANWIFTPAGIALTAGIAAGTLGLFLGVAASRTSRAGEMQRSDSQVQDLNRLHIRTLDCCRRAAILLVISALATAIAWELAWF